MTTWVAPGGDRDVGVRPQSGHRPKQLLCPLGAVALAILAYKGFTTITNSGAAGHAEMAVRQSSASP
jgi:hypothetical protein